MPSIHRRLPRTLLIGLDLTVAAGGPAPELSPLSQWVGVDVTLCNQSCCAMLEGC
ncbi:MAG: hypothetical protein ACQEW0_17955 [Pseudomonadota bacterium]